MKTNQQQKYSKCYQMQGYFMPKQPKLLGSLKEKNFSLSIFKNI